jgi:hypothetical protein
MAPAGRQKRMRNPGLSQAEQGFLFALCRFFLGGGKNPVIVPDGSRFDVMTQVMIHNGCGGIMFSLLERSATTWPEGDALHFREHYLSILAANELYGKLAAELNDKARAAGMPCLFFKGLGLIDGAYGERGWRPVSDIDILVPGAKSAQRLAALAGADTERHGGGFTRRYKEYNRLNSQVLFAGRRIGLEFHFPMPNPALPLSRLAELARGDLFGAGAFRSGRLDVPEPALHLLLLLVHLVNHHLGTRLIWHLDIAALIRRHGNELDWDKAVFYAEAIEFFQVLRTVLDSIRTRFGVPVPEIERVRSGRVALSQLNRGLLTAMIGADNVLGDRFGGRRIWESPALSPAKFKTIVLYSLFPLLFNDQAGKWLRFNFGDRRKGAMLSGLLALSLDTVPERIPRPVQAALRFLVLPLLSLAALPVLLFFRFKAAGPSAAENKKPAS